MSTTKRTLSILEFWRNIEFFQPFDLDDMIGEEPGIFFVSPELRLPAPWTEPALWGLDPNKEYAFDLFTGVFHKQEVFAVLKDCQIKGAEFEYNDARELEGRSCLLQLPINAEGVLQLGEMRVSTLPWALHQLRHNGPLSIDDFDDYCKSLADTLLALPGTGLQKNAEEIDFGEEKVNSLDTDGVISLCHRVIGTLDLNFCTSDLLGVIVSRPLRKKKAPQPGPPPEQQAPSIPRRRRRFDILNSFFLRDLKRAAAMASRDPSCLVSAYMRQDCAVRTDVSQSPAYCSEMLRPSKTPHGRWPTPSTQRSTVMQQIAINSHTHGSERITAINGPPGTGKTSLIKDVIAAVIVERAAAFAKLQRIDDAFLPTRSVMIGSKFEYVRPLKPELTGFELVVASSNNNAVENISHELPNISSISPEFPNARYLTETAALYESIIGGDVPENSGVWGLPSAALGNRGNRDRFAQAIFWGPHEKEEEGIARVKEGKRLTLREWRRASISSGRRPFSALAADFNQLNSELAAILEQLDKVYQVSGAQPNSDITSLKQHQAVEWHTDEIEKKRAELFLVALALQEAFILEAKPFEQSLSAIALLIRQPHLASAEAARCIWPLVFLIAPVVSTTLASVERMFANLGPNTLGHILIDEAGQATPQSIVGILARAKRAMVVGDPLQLEPVVQVPELLIHHFAKNSAPDPAEWPFSSSAQALADRAAKFGTEIMSNGSPIWVGSPLRVHRRCCEPMFSISNSIAYGGLMLLGRSHQPSISPLGSSAWLQCTGSTTSKQWVPEQGELCIKLLERLLGQSEVTSDFYFITPFREIRKRLQTLLVQSAKRLGLSAQEQRTLRAKVGTIHTFQGKEAAMVFLVLGCDSKTVGSANWASNKPNLLNVAVTRAKDHLYVIGDREVWDRGVFVTLLRKLPIR